MPKVIFNIATIQSRKKLFIEVLKRLSQQFVPCDHINVALSYDAPDREVEENILQRFKSGTFIYGKFPAAKKMFAIDSTDPDTIFLTFDDDIAYPRDYSQDIIKHINKNRDAVIGYHGMAFNFFPVVDYYKQRAIYQYFETIREPVSVHIIGTGICGFYTATLKEKGFTYSWFDQYPQHGNYNDSIFSLFLRLHKIPMVVVPHYGGWTYSYPGSQDETALWKQAKKDFNKTDLIFLQQ